MKMIFQTLIVCLSILTTASSAFAHSEIEGVEFVTTGGVGSTVGLLAGIANQAVGGATTVVGSVVAISLCLVHYKQKNGPDSTAALLKNCSGWITVGPAVSVTLVMSKPTEATSDATERLKNFHLVFFRGEAKEFLLTGDSEILSEPLLAHLDEIRDVARLANHDAIAHASDAEILWALYPSIAY